MHIGSVIKQIRKEKGISQLELASRCDITQAALSQIESGAKSPGKETLVLICKELNVTPALLHVLCLEEADVPKENRIIYNKLFPEVKELILKIVKGK